MKSVKQNKVIPNLIWDLTHLPLMFSNGGFTRPQRTEKLGIVSRYFPLTCPPGILSPTGEEHNANASESPSPLRGKVAAGRMRGYHVGQALPDNAPKGHLSLFTRPSSSRSVLMRDIGALYGIATGRAGFTLIEILVVVLIIGILGAIMLPQYQRAVLKSRFAALMPIAKSMADSNEAYYLEHGEYADNAEDLPVQGRMNYSDGTELEFGTTSEYSYVLATRDNDFPNNYIVYQKHSEQFPGEIHCEADSTNDMAKEVCKSFGATGDIGEILTEGFTTYVLSGTGHGVAPSRCPSGATCDDNGNVTECPGGQTLHNGSCEDCTTAFPGAATCSTTAYKPTKCSTGYTLKGNACEEIHVMTAAEAQAFANGHCQNPSSGCIGIPNNDGTVSVCENYSGTVDGNGKCVSNGQQAGYYERIYEADGNEVGYYYCSVSEGHCIAVGNLISTSNGAQGVYRACADTAAITKEGICSNGYSSTDNYDRTYDSHGQRTSSFTCLASAISTETGKCGAYSSMVKYDNNYDANGNYIDRVKHTCTSISEKDPTQCLTWDPPL